MSLIGIDVGSSSVKIAAYDESNGALLALAQREITPLHPQPGWWEQDAEEIWRATSDGMIELMATPALRDDPPKALAVSASGRENFLASENGQPISPGVMGADVRGEAFEQRPSGTPNPELWTVRCGHLRERMDPVFRYQWWASVHPEKVAQSHYFLGWHDFLTLRISGRAVTDRSQAGRWATWDLEAGDWDSEQIQAFELPPRVLPEVLPWGVPVGEVLPEVAQAWGFPKGIILANGSMDLNCCALGVGVASVGTACLVSGSYENILIPTATMPTPSMLLRGLSVTPHPSVTGLSVFAICPTGNAVLNWAREQLHLGITEVNNALSERTEPSSITAVPHLSGAMLYWDNGRKIRGALVGMTLATTGIDIVQAFMESIAYDHVNTLALLNLENIPVERFIATGGGTRSPWWTQLKADLTNTPIEVVDQREPGTLGAALLAGYAIGVIDDVEQAARLFSTVEHIYEPNPIRAQLHKERLAEYRHTIEVLLQDIYR